MKAIQFDQLNPLDAPFQEMTGMKRVKGSWARKYDSYFEKLAQEQANEAFWDEIFGRLGSFNSGTGGGFDFQAVVDGFVNGVSESSDNSVSLYGLYTSEAAAAFGWSRTFGSLGNTTSKIEYSGLIYSIMVKGIKYFGFTRAVRFPENWKAKNFSPGHYHELHKSTLPPEATIVGQIHLHYAASDPANRKFSEQAGGDRDQHANNPDISFYLLNNDGNLISHISKEYFVNTPYIQKVGYNFYGFEHNVDYTEKTNGKITGYWQGNIAYPERTPTIPSLRDTFPKLYIDFVSGKTYGPDFKPL